MAIPAWDVAEYEGQAIDSVLGRTFGEFESGVVKGGPPDTKELERGLGAYGGLTGARKVGVAAARRWWVTFLDARNEWMCPVAVRLRLTCADTFKF